jgi:hypothetical protein
MKKSSIKSSPRVFIRDAYSAYDSAERRIMIHEKIVFKNKQLIESIELKSSSRLMKDNRLASIISFEIFDDESENARIFITFEILINWNID